MAMMMVIEVMMMVIEAMMTTVDTAVAVEAAAGRE